MKHLKSIQESFNQEDYYTELTSDQLYKLQGPEYSKCINLNKVDKSYLKDLKIKDDRYFINFINWRRTTIFTYAQIGAYQKHWTTSSHYIKILKIPDDWFLVLIDKGPMVRLHSSFYKCDQIEGVTKLLTDLGYAEENSN
jgi:hypothetical protein